RCASVGRVDFGLVAIATGGLSAGNADDVPARLSALRLYLFDFEHAGRDPTDFGDRASTVFHRHHQSAVPEGHRDRAAMAGFPAAVHLWGGDVLFRGAKTAPEGGVNYAATASLHDSQGIHTGAARSAHARHADHSSTAAIADFRLC